MQRLVQMEGQSVARKLRTKSNTMELNLWSRLPLAISLSSVVFVQSEVGGASLNGTVTDPSGAVINGAKLTVTNSGAGLARTLSTSGEGLWRRPIPLPPHSTDCGAV